MFHCRISRPRNRQSIRKSTSGFHLPVLFEASLSSKLLFAFLRPACRCIETLFPHLLSQIMGSNITRSIKPSLLFLRNELNLSDSQVLEAFHSPYLLLLASPPPCSFSFPSSSSFCLPPLYDAWSRFTDSSSELLRFFRSHPIASCGLILTVSFTPSVIVLPPPPPLACPSPSSSSSCVSFVLPIFSSSSPSTSFSAILLGLILAPPLAPCSLPLNFFRHLSSAARKRSLSRSLPPLPQVRTSQSSWFPPPPPLSPPPTPSSSPLFLLPFRLTGAAVSKRLSSPTLTSSCEKAS